MPKRNASARWDGSLLALFGELGRAGHEVESVETEATGRPAWTTPG